MPHVTLNITTKNKLKLSPGPDIVKDTFTEALIKSIGAMHCSSLDLLKHKMFFKLGSLRNKLFGSQAKIILS